MAQGDEWENICFNVMRGIRPRSECFFFALRFDVNKLVLMGTFESKKWLARKSWL